MIVKDGRKEGRILKRKRKETWSTASAHGQMGLQKQGNKEERKVRKKGKKECKEEM